MLLGGNRRDHAAVHAAPVRRHRRSGGARPVTRVLGSPPRLPSGLDRLSATDRTLLVALAQGSTIRGAGLRLGIAESTAKNRLAHLYARLGAQSATHAVGLALKAGLLTLDEL